MSSSSSEVSLIDRIFGLSDAIRYVALYRKDELVLRQKSQLAGASGSTPLGYWGAIRDLALASG